MSDRSLNLTKDDLVPDAALQATDRDELNHAPVAGVICRLALAVDTKSNIALFGPWGSGKSSIYSMVRRAIQSADPAVAVIDYDAWKFGGNSLHRNFLMGLLHG